MSFQMTSFENILNYFKLRNCGLNSKLCAKRKLSHPDANTCVFFFKKETLKFVIERRNYRCIGKLCTLIFLPNVDIFIAAFPRSGIVVLENSVFQ